MKREKAQARTMFALTQDREKQSETKAQVRDKTARHEGIHLIDGAPFAVQSDCVLGVSVDFNQVKSLSLMNLL